MKNLLIYLIITLTLTLTCLGHAKSDGLLKRFISIENEILIDPKLLENPKFMNEHFTQSYIYKLNELNNADLTDNLCGSLINGKSCFSEVYKYRVGTLKNETNCIQVIGNYIGGTDGDLFRSAGSKVVTFKNVNDEMLIESTKSEVMNWHDFGMKLLRGSDDTEIFHSNCTE